jgi:hypothetical protein
LNPVRWVKGASFAALVFGAACSDGLFVLPSQETPPPDPGAAEKANLSVVFVGDPAVIVPGATTNSEFVGTLQITETAGVGARINFIRLQLLRSGVEVERSEVGADLIVPDNRIDPSSTTRIDVRLGFNSRVADLDGIFSVSFTDDRGNVIDISMSFTIG